MCGTRLTGPRARNKVVGCVKEDGKMITNPDGRGSRNVAARLMFSLLKIPQHSLGITDHWHASNPGCSSVEMKK